MFASPKKPHFMSTSTAHFLWNIISWIKKERSNLLPERVPKYCLPSRPNSVIITTLIKDYDFRIFLVLRLYCLDFPHKINSCVLDYLNYKACWRTWDISILESLRYDCSGLDERNTHSRQSTSVLKGFCNVPHSRLKSEDPSPRRVPADCVLTLSSW